MDSDHEAEIRASVGAHRDLGSGYDDAVAEGLVERIGAEIDKRVDARLARFGPHWAVAHQPPRYWATGWQAPQPGGQAPQPGAEVPQPRGEVPQPGAEVPQPGGEVPQPGYQALPGYQAPPAYYQAPGPPTPDPIPAWPPHRSVAATLIALGSMGMGVAATAVVAHAANANSGVQAIMVLVIWTAIAVINVGYARHR